MKAWLADALRTVFALSYWNARKSAFVLRGRRGQCPCHNPSDTGEPGKTGCEAVLGWREPRRFQRRVCPLLIRNDAGSWVCSAPPERVRPFWGPWLILHGGAAMVAAVLFGLVAFVALRQIGYRISLAQVFWPPRWSEFGLLRVELFADQAKEHYEAGRIREAIAALAMAHTLQPDNYAYAMMLAQFYQAGMSDAADPLYRRLMQTHPERRNETARVWFRSLLSRGRFGDVAELARRQLAHEPAQASAWLHALFVSTRALHRTEPLESALADATVPEAARRLIELELAVRSRSRDEARAHLLAAALPAEPPYARVHRIELLVEFDLPDAAVALAAESRFVLSGRDVVRLALSARAARRDRAGIRTDLEALLAPERAVGLAEISLVAQHLIRHPDREFLALLAQSMPRAKALPVAEHLEAWVNFFCAAGAALDREQLTYARENLLSFELLTPAALSRLEAFFSLPAAQQRIEFLLPQLQPFSLDLSYALCGRYTR